MSNSRAGRVNALAFAILDANGDNDRLAEQMRFFRDLTDSDVDQAMMLAHWVKTTGGPQLVQQIVRPLGVQVASHAETACTA
jgi:ferritin